MGFKILYYKFIRKHFPIHIVIHTKVPSLLITATSMRVIIHEKGIDEENWDSNINDDNFHCVHAIG